VQKNNQLNGKIINIWKSSVRDLPPAYDGKKNTSDFMKPNVSLLLMIKNQRIKIIN
jgi:hypothetical protein